MIPPSRKLIGTASETGSDLNGNEVVRFRVRPGDVGVFAVVFDVIMAAILFVVLGEIAFRSM